MMINAHKVKGRAMVAAFMLCLFHWPSISLACSPIIWPWSGLGSDVHRSVVQNPSGSFDTGGRRGKPAFDLGNGRIGQVIISNGPCLRHEMLMLVDCKALEMVAVDSVPDYHTNEPVTLQGTFTVDQWLPPKGALAEVAGEPVAKMRSFLLEKGANPSNELFAWNKAEKPRDQFNPFAGCKRFYPKSEGAAYAWPKT